MTVTRSSLIFSSNHKQQLVNHYKEPKNLVDLFRSSTLLSFFGKGSLKVCRLFERKNFCSTVMETVSHRLGSTTTDLSDELRSSLKGVDA